VPYHTPADDDELWYLHAVALLEDLSNLLLGKLAVLISLFTENVLCLFGGYFRRVFSHCLKLRDDIDNEVGSGWSERARGEQLNADVITSRKGVRVQSGNGVVGRGVGG